MPTFSFGCLPSKSRKQCEFHLKGLRELGWMSTIDLLLNVLEVAIEPLTTLPQLGVALVGASSSCPAQTLLLGFVSSLAQQLRRKVAKVKAREVSQALEVRVHLVDRIIVIVI